jgi:outer membrane lipoprotein carrier protein
MKTVRLLALAVTTFALGIGVVPSTAGTAEAQDAPPAGSATPGAPTVDDISAKVQAFYNQTKTFQAQFNQTYKVKAYNQTKKSSGRVVFEKPGKMAWTYDAPNGNRVVSDGKSLKVYEKDNNQMFEQPVEKSQYPAALSFLMGQGELTKSFNLKQLDAAAMKFEGGYVLEGTPKEATPAYQKVLFYIDRETSQVRRVIILDAQGNKNEFTFKTPIVNKPPALPTETFEFTPPQGTQVIHP